jgi:hypothetical protein
MPTTISFAGLKFSSVKPHSASTKRIESQQPLQVNVTGLPTGFGDSNLAADGGKYFVLIAKIPENTGSIKITTKYAVLEWHAQKDASKVSSDDSDEGSSEITGSPSSDVSEGESASSLKEKTLAFRAFNLFKKWFPLRTN